jgi:hypothetical protein
MLEIIIGAVILGTVAYIIGYRQGRISKLDDAEAKLQPLSPNRCWWCRQSPQ